MNAIVQEIQSTDQANLGLENIRTLPHNLEAEQGLLGALFFDNRALDHIADFLHAEHFFVPAHQRIYRVIGTLIDRGQNATPVTLKQYFENDDDLEHVGGALYLADLADSIVSVVNVKDYARTIFDLHLARCLIARCQETTERAYEPTIEHNAADLIEEHEAALFALAESGVDQSAAVSFRDSIATAIDLAQRAYQSTGQVSGVSTGLIDLDKILGGLHPTDLIILAGRPSMGKTALATNIAMNAATRHLETNGQEGAVVGFYSLEMAHSQITSRILADLSQVSSDAIRKGNIEAADFERFAEVGRKFHDLPLYTDDTAGLTIAGLRTRARRLKRKHGISLLVVDYLQLLHGPNTRRSSESRNQEISAITRGLKCIAKDLNIPVLALSQLSRQVEQREDKRPQLSDLRDSGSIEQDADVVMFVYREEYYLSREEPLQKAPEGEEKYAQKILQWEQALDASKDITEVLVSKQRHGPIGNVKLHFDPHFTRFSNLET